MATTTAAITLTSSDLTTDALSLSSTATLTKAGSSVGLDQTTGVGRKHYATASQNQPLLLASNYTNAKQHKVYIKNTSSSDTETVRVEVGGSNLALGNLSGGDWAFIPWNGENDIDVTTSANAMTVEFMVINE